MKCSECGELADEDATICHNCGKAFSNSAQDQQGPNKYYCDVCHEELEYITTYKQWYCYNCQNYVDLPIPSTTTDAEEVPVEVPEEVPSADSQPEVAWDGEEDTLVDENDKIYEEEYDDTKDTDASTIENTISEESRVDEIVAMSDEEVDFEIDPDYNEIDVAETTSIPKQTDLDTDIKKKALSKLHQAWLKVNNLKGLKSDIERISQLEVELESALKGDYDPKDIIILADESLDELVKLEKVLKEEIHNEISNLFHFVNSKILLAKKIGFNVNILEDKLDTFSSLIAMGEYHRARSELEACLQNIFELPKTQNEIMIGLNEQSDLIQELLEPQSRKVFRKKTLFYHTSLG